MNYKIYCSFCNQLLPTPSIDSFKECKNHPVIVHFYNSITILQNNDYYAYLRHDLTEISSKEPSKLIISIPETIPITPESFDSTIQKLLSLKAFL
tara:strand:- start:84 stop:368 length:285 start_codon:yes stop_codon:yes gene_type:complete